MTWQGDPRTSTPEWRKLRAFVLERDGRRCYVCGGPANEVDHVDGDKRNNRPANLKAICGGPGSCHAKKSSAEGNAARWAGRKRPTPRHPGLVDKRGGG